LSAPAPTPSSVRRRPPALRRDLRLVFLEIVGWALMVGWGEQYLAPLALALGVSESLSGLVNTIPFVIGALAGLLVPALIRRAGSYRTVTVALAGIQGLALLPLIAAALVGSMPFPALLLVLSVYFAAGLGMFPPWMAWSDVLVPKLVRPRFFAYRTLLARLSTGASLLASGWVLETLTGMDLRLEGFALLLTVAFLARMGSTATLAAQSDVPAPAEEVREVPFRVLLCRKEVRKDGTLILFLLCFVGALSIALWLLPALLLEQRQLSYTQWSVLFATPLLSRVAALPFMGHLAATRGPTRVLAAGTAGTGLVFLLWTRPWGFAYYLGVAVLEGIAGSAYVLGGFLLLFDAIPREERCATLAKVNVAVGATMAAGAILGGGILRVLGESELGYTAVFGTSGVLVLASLAILRGFDAPPPAGRSVDAEEG